ncbi:MAG: carboxypeptidase regulatory-like domain-containing protein [Thermodesulfobacteriota bacterium]
MNYRYSNIILVLFLLTFLSTGLADSAVISGRARILGKPPALPPLPVTKSKDVCGSTKANEALLSQRGGIQNVVVTIYSDDNRLTNRNASPSPVVLLDNRECGFSPHVLAVTVGTTIKIVNNDPILHNVHANFMHIKWSSSSQTRLVNPHAQAKHGRTVFNLGLPIQGVKVKRVMKRVGLIHVMCDEHKWMSAYIWVMDHPYFAVTDEGGSFEIANVPPGKYKIRAWHETLGVREIEMEVREGEKLDINFDFRVPAKLAKGRP